MLRCSDAQEEVNKIKGFTNSECPNHLGGCYKQNHRNAAQSAALRKSVLTGWWTVSIKAGGGNRTRIISLEG